MKPPGLALNVGPQGVGLRVTKGSDTENAVWEAVEQAFIDGVSADEFRKMVWQAWDDELDNERKRGKKEAEKAFSRDYMK
jgi:hypothetical protein